MKNILVSWMLLLSITTLPAFGDHHMEMTNTKDTSSLSSMNDIVDNAINSSSHTTLVTAVSAAWLVDALKWDGPFTVFAPTNDAFNKLPDGTLDSLLEPDNIDDLTWILTYHVVPGKYLASDIKDGLELETLEGRKITFSIEKWNVYINWRSMVTSTDIDSSNWVIHVIDWVLLPQASYSERTKESLMLRSMIDKEYESKVDNVVNKFYKLTRNFSKSEKNKLEDRFIWLIDDSIMSLNNQWSSNDLVNILKLLKLELLNNHSSWVMVWSESLVPSKNVVENAIASKYHTTLVTAVLAANLSNALQAEWPITVFAPTNDAFSKLPEGTVEWLLEEENIDDLTSVLTYHVVAWAYLSSDIKDWLELTTLQWNKIKFSIIDWNVYINWESKVELADIISSNWVIHSIDGVLLP